MDEYVRHYLLKRTERPGDVFGPLSVTVVYCAGGRIKVMEQRDAGRWVVQRWVLPVDMAAV